MSAAVTTRPRMAREDVAAWADYVRRRLEPACAKVEIAGSLRRGAATVGDVELVCVPRAVELFEPDLAATIEAMTREGGDCPWIAWDTETRRNGKRYKRLASASAFPGLPVDLFIAEAGNFGNTMALRTGDAEFSHLLVTEARHGGLMPRGMKHDGGWLWRGEDRVECPTEAEFFAALGLSPPAPSDRDAACARWLAQSKRTTQRELVR